MFSLKKLAAIASAALLISAVSASAAVVLDKTTPLGALVPVANPAPTSTTGVYFDNVTGGIVNVRRDVWEGTANAGTGAYSSVSGGGSATFVLGGVFSALDLAWGSPDTYNDIDFFLGAVMVDTINGALIQPPVAVEAALVRIGAIAGGVFDTVVIRSGSNAFEFANLAAIPIPLPAAAWLLLAGIGGLGVASRRRKAAA